MALLGSNVTTYQKRETPYWLNFVYSGQMYKWTYKTTINGSSTLYYLIKTSNSLFHSLSRLISVSQTTLQISLIENPTVDSYSVEKTSNNLYRSSSKVANTKFYTTVSISGGTVIDEIWAPMHYPIGKTSLPAGSLIAGLTERIHKPNSNYAIKIENTGGFVGDFQLIELFYESSN